MPTEQRGLPRVRLVEGLESCATPLRVYYRFDLDCGYPCGAASPSLTELEGLFADHELDRWPNTTLRQTLTVRRAPLQAGHPAILIVVGSVFRIVSTTAIEARTGFDQPACERLALRIRTAEVTGNPDQAFRRGVRHPSGRSSREAETLQSVAGASGQ